MLDAFLGSTLEDLVVSDGQLVDGVSVPAGVSDMRVRKNLFPGTVVASDSDIINMELMQQEVTFTEVLGDFLAQDFPPKEGQSLAFLGAIPEERGTETEVSPQGEAEAEGEEEAEGTEDFLVEEEANVEDLSDQGLAEDISKDTLPSDETGGTFPPPRSKVVKGKGFLQGVSTKKRNMVTMASPRKKVVTKGAGLMGKVGSSHQGGKPPSNAAA
ncbi:PREDICTED: uncharacterized protein LOC109132977 [Camelina sativa]|uniref:Uncharacterized protein LOC109127175 n=1 Tax=Camelina sativa TaxID=90675 RepID=A0ABM1RPV1_CAMSA|nr:PREDICTED: uncharacterized protein LOC109127175 [Camelina sativa]XP_019101039.1 PREDICTED: uncharacterized protein LOC109132977 [Camelina sativa]